MLNRLAFVAALTLFASGCRDDGTVTHPDFSVNRDLAMAVVTDGGGGGNDLSVTKMYMDVTPNAIDTGTLADMTAVRLTRVVAVTPVDRFFSHTTGYCHYQMWVQDPACTTPPCGLNVQASGEKLVLDASVGSCKSTSTSGTPLASVHVGDTIDVVGVTHVYTSGTIREHVIFADGITPNSNAGTITPLPITTVPATLLQTGMGTDWATYEGTYINIRPATGNLTVSSIDSSTPYHYHTMPGNTDWGTTYRFGYSDGGDLPVATQTFKGLSGVVTLSFGGAVLATKMEDFQTN
jgi:hypothetical protein